ncbi:hypothetical protein VZT92_015090 [Zoarces viviparus]|uniref:Uncharacterized protein n=1 Tax=Zoarces viviparus TaxID=48416 RepID=A0AAW1EYD7_ZOAVI
MIFTLVWSSQTASDSLVTWLQCIRLTRSGPQVILLRCLLLQYPPHLWLLETLTLPVAHLLCLTSGSSPHPLPPGESF